ncbi:hypothetical protein POKO110462_20530 [Pontibacter korlensis]|uniref:Uncharacterized protein n=1 Tax=Pontibacter korlensis TaxID=400092 RepID=A0A0E3UYJ8_9BACT|nr:hypothetical protein [Pontibacter korlensis]AKD05202.1 hypothetical protein PKOR_21690 [Pontibacter korlensis]
MNAKALNESIVAILEKKQELRALDYNDARYDDIEEELHDLEDDFNEEYGDELEDVLEDVHGKIKSDADILLPTAYLASSLDGKELEDGDETEGVWVESDSFPGVEMRLVLVANPPRVLLVLADQERVLWTAE